MMAQAIAAALQRVEEVLRRRPSAGLGDDASAMARWDGGTKVITSHANGMQAVTDMPPVLGGEGAGVTPGWLLRAALASCVATRIAMDAAAEGIELKTLALIASSRSDMRGMLGMADADGAPVHAEPRDVQLLVRISAIGATPERLRALVEASHRSSPVSCAMQQAVPVALRVEVGAE
ncbi:MAG: OsmC family protein [Steroidobacterales bacterium]